MSVTHACGFVTMCLIFLALLHMLAIVQSWELERPVTLRCDTADATSGLVDFLQAQAMWHWCLVSAHAGGRLAPYTRPRYGFTEGHVMRELCREHIKPHWIGPECIATIAPNGTVIGPRDAIHDAIAPYVQTLKAHLVFIEDGCGVKNMRLARPTWRGTYTCDGDGALEHIELFYHTCITCIHTTITPTVHLTG